jgi:quinol monooxygenase YgiN
MALGRWLRRRFAITSCAFLSANPKIKSEVETVAVVLTGYIKVSRSERRVSQQHLAQHIQNTRQEAGCLAFEVNQSAEDDCVFTVFECFKDQAAFESHQARVKVSFWSEISCNTERVFSIETQDAATSVKAL